MFCLHKIILELFQYLIGVCNFFFPEFECLEDIFGLWNLLSSIVRKLPAVLFCMMLWWACLVVMDVMDLCWSHRPDYPRCMAHGLVDPTSDTVCYVDIQQKAIWTIQAKSVCLQGLYPPSYESRVLTGYDLLQSRLYILYLGPKVFK